MPACARPRTQWVRGETRTFNRPLSPALWDELQFRCGKCAPCLLSKAGQQMVRLTHEGYSHPPGQSISLCLTYAPAFLPPLGSLRVADWTRFLNSLRKRIERRGGSSIMFDAVGEYSPPPALRPHIHAALFGYCPPDVEPFGDSRGGNPEFRSDEIDELWGKGRATFQFWTHGSASYIAGHNSAKLMTRKLSLKVCAPDGTYLGTREREFHRSSKRPGIGRRYLEEHGEQALRNGFVVASDRPVALPKYYMTRAAITFPELAEQHAALRKSKAVEAANRPGPSLDAIEFCAEEKIRRGSRRHGL